MAIAARCWRPRFVLRLPGWWIGGSSAELVFQLGWRRWRLLVTAYKGASGSSLLLVFRYRSGVRLSALVADDKKIRATRSAKSRDESGTVVPERDNRPLIDMLRSRD